MRNEDVCAPICVSTPIFPKSSNLSILFQKTSLAERVGHDQPILPQCLGHIPCVRKCVLRS